MNEWGCFPQTNNRISYRPNNKSSRWSWKKRESLGLFSERPSLISNHSTSTQKSQVVNATLSSSLSPTYFPCKIYLHPPDLSILIWKINVRVGLDWLYIHMYIFSCMTCSFRFRVIPVGTLSFFLESLSQTIYGMANGNVDKMTKKEGKESAFILWIYLLI